MSALPAAAPSIRTDYALEPARLEDAHVVAAWAQDAAIAYWFAPRSRPPITAQTILSWRSQGHSPHVLRSRAEPRRLIAYGEVNLLSASRQRYWLGHLIVAEAHRGAGFGRVLVASLLNHAFGFLAAREVVLVVFEENQRAIQCYRACGMRLDGFEYQFLAPYLRRVRLIRMSINRDEYSTWASAAERRSAQPVPPAGY